MYKITQFHLRPGHASNLPINQLSFWWLKKTEHSQASTRVSSAQRSLSSLTKGKERRTLNA